MIRTIRCHKEHLPPPPARKATPYTAAATKLVGQMRIRRFLYQMPKRSIFPNDNPNPEQKKNNEQPITPPVAKYVDEP